MVILYSSLQNDSFQIIIQLKEYTHQPMEAVARQRLCGDTLNIFGRKD
jgi:hypothetical protein